MIAYCICWREDGGGAKVNRFSRMCSDARVVVRSMNLFLASDDAGFEESIVVAVVGVTAVSSVSLVAFRLLFN